LRRREIVPRLRDQAIESRFEVACGTGLAVDWTLGDGSRLHLRANYGPREIADIPPAAGALLHAEGGRPLKRGLAAWSGTWTLEPA
jgi:uncharacterized protein DUF3459